jgi:DNA-binding transcriptional LysR family regulator
MGNRVMIKRNLNDLLSFVTVAREGSFTRAAALLGMTQSALSQAISGLETRLQIRLLTRTTRSVSPTAAGERLLQAIGHRFDEIEAELDVLTELRDKPAGTVRITCGDHVLRTTLLPKLIPLLHEYPDIKVEFDVNYGFRDIVADRFDAGVRLGDTIDKDMIAVPIGPELRMAVAASPAYFATHPLPKNPHDLLKHNCINQRMLSSGGLYVWDFERRGQQLNVRVDGQLIFNTTPHMVDAALAGLGIAFLPEEEFAPHLQEGRLMRALDDWCAPFSGYYLYYPNRRQPSPAFSLVVNALRVHVVSRR